MYCKFDKSNHPPGLTWSNNLVILCDQLVWSKDLERPSLSRYSKHSFEWFLARPRKTMSFEVMPVLREKLVVNLSVDWSFVPNLMFGYKYPCMASFVSSTHFRENQCEAHKIENICVNKVSTSEREFLFVKQGL